MSHPNPERDERRCQHGLVISDPCDECNALAEAEQQLNRSEHPERVWITWDDAYPWETPEMGGDEYVRVELLNDAAIRMRDRCLEKLKSLHDEYESQEYAPGAMVLSKVIQLLESLTLEGEQEKQKPVDVCVVCKSEPVCPEEGFDTCTYCARRI